MKTIQILAFAAIFGSMTLNSIAQNEKVKAGYGVHVSITQPEFPGGMDSLKMFIHNNLKYPRQLMDSRTGGSVVIMFIVDKDGKIVDPVVMKGVNPDVNEEALRIIKMMPDWKPGTNGGMPVNKQYILPIDFVPPSI